MTRIQRAIPRAPLHPLSALLLLLADWAILGLNLLTAMHAYWAVDVGSALGAGALVTLIERRLSWVSVRAALLRGGLCGLLIALPFPIAGTVVAFTILAWTWSSMRSGRA